MGITTISKFLALKMDTEKIVVSYQRGSVRKWNSYKNGQGENLSVIGKKELNSYD